MDSFADVLPFVLVAIYIVARVLRKANRKQAPAGAPARRPAAPSRAAAVSGPTPFEQLVARLDEARAEAGEPRLTDGPPARVQNARLLSSEVGMSARHGFDYLNRPGPGEHGFDYLNRPTAGVHGFDHEAHDFDEEMRGFDHERRDFEHERHGFGADNPASEETFQRLPRADERPRGPGRLGYDPHGLTHAPALAGAQSVADRLRSPESVRDAFILSTVLTRRPQPRRR